MVSGMMLDPWRPSCFCVSCRGTVEPQDLPLILKVLKAGLQTKEPAAFRTLPQDVVPLVAFGESFSAANASG
jgi:hypothetical protein